MYGDTTRVTYGITQRLLAKRGGASRTGGASGAKGAQDLLSVQLSQSYYSNKSASTVDGSKSSVTRQGAARVFWVGARSGGFHFRWDGAAWRDARGGTELFSALSDLVSGQLGRRVRLLG